MKIKVVTVGDIGENAYILDCGNEVIIIDPGADHDKISAAADGKPCGYVLLTHAHYDHIGAVAAFQREGAKVYMHRDDLKLLNGDGNLASLFGEKLDRFVPDVLLSGGETLELNGEKISVVSTPGHTDGSVCYIVDDIIFSGDTLFYMACGRTDMPSGNAAKMRGSLNKLISLSADCKVFPGHGMTTTLFFEKNHNPYV